MTINLRNLSLFTSTCATGAFFYFPSEESAEETNSIASRSITSLGIGLATYFITSNSPWISKQIMIQSSGHASKIRQAFADLHKAGIPMREDLERFLIAQGMHAVEIRFILEALYNNGLLIEKNFDKLSEISDIEGFAELIIYLNQNQILTQDNFDKIHKLILHNCISNDDILLNFRLLNRANLPITEEIFDTFLRENIPFTTIESLYEAGILTEETLDLLQTMTDRENEKEPADIADNKEKFYDMVEKLGRANILSRENLHLLWIAFNKESREKILRIIERLVEKDILTQKTYRPILTANKIERAESIARSILNLRNDRLFTEENLNAVLIRNGEDACLIYHYISAFDQAHILTVENRNVLLMENIKCNIRHVGDTILNMNSRGLFTQENRDAFLANCGARVSTIYWKLGSQFITQELFDKTITEIEYKERKPCRDAARLLALRNRGLQPDDRTRLSSDIIAKIAGYLVPQGSNHTRELWYIAEATTNWEQINEVVTPEESPSSSLAQRDDVFILRLKQWLRQNDR